MMRTLFCSTINVKIHQMSVKVVVLILFFNAQIAHSQNIITLKNPNWEALELEVRIGSADICEENPINIEDTLYRDETIDVECHRPKVCWRIKVLDYSDEDWRTWVSDACLSDSEHTLN